MDNPVVTVKNSFLRGHNTEQGQPLKKNDVKFAQQKTYGNFTYCSV